MAERFRIDLGFPALYASLSQDTSGITDGVVVYDKERQQLFYTGSYGSGGGTGSVDPSLYLKTASVDLNTLIFTKGDGTAFELTIDTGSGGGSNYWLLNNNSIINSGSLDIIITSSLTITQPSNSEDAFLIRTNGVDRLKINGEGTLILIEQEFLPTAISGGIVYVDNEFYFGYS